MKNDHFEKKKWNQTATENDVGVKDVSIHMFKSFDIVYIT